MLDLLLWCSLAWADLPPMPEEPPTDEPEAALPVQEVPGEERIDVAPPPRPAAGPQEVVQGCLGVTSLGGLLGLGVWGLGRRREARDGLAT